MTSPQSPAQHVLETFEATLRTYRAESTVKLRIYYIQRLATWLQTHKRTFWTARERDLVTWMTKEIGSAPNTRRSARHSLSVFYDWAVKFDYTDYNPTIKLPSVRSPQGVPHPVPDDAIHQALQRCTRPVDVLMLILGEYEGLRCCEMAALHTNDIDHDRNQLRVVGKGSKERVLPIHPLVAKALHRVPRGYVFPSELNPTGHMLAQSIGQRVRFLMGSHRGHNAHSLRHKFACDVLDRDPNLMGLRDLLGHASVATTQIYTRASTRHTRVMVENLPYKDDRLQTLTALARQV